MQKIGIDLDGTLADHTQAKLQIAREFGLKLLPEQTASPVLKTFLSEEQYALLKERLYNTLAQNATPMPGAREALEKAKEQHLELYVISFQPREPHRQRATSWLRAHFSDLIPERNYLLVADPSEKERVCRENNIDAHIDDHINILESLSSVRLKILFDQYGNASAAEAGDIRLLRSWANLESVLVD